MNFPRLPVNKLIFVVVFVFVSFFYLKHEIEFAKYSKIVNNIQENLVEVKPDTDPLAVSNGFVFMRATLRPQQLNDNLYGKEFPVKSFAIKREVEECKIISSNFPNLFGRYEKAEWEPVKKVSIRTPDITRLILPDEEIPVGHFNISQSFLLTNKPDFELGDEGINFKKFTILKLGKKNILKEKFHSILPEKSIKYYTYIGKGWFYSAKRGNVEAELKRVSHIHSSSSSSSSSSSFFSDLFDLKSFFMFLFRILFSVLFRSFVFINIPGSINNKKSEQVLDQSEKIDLLMKHCEPGDIRIRYLYLYIKNISLIAYKEKKTLKAKKVGKFNIGTFVKAKVSQQRVMPKYPPGGSHDFYLWMRAAMAFLTVSAVYMFADPSMAVKRRAALLITIGGAVGTFRSIIWKKEFLQYKIWMPILIVSLGVFHFI